MNVINYLCQNLGIFGEYLSVYYVTYILSFTIHGRMNQMYYWI